MTSKMNPHQPHWKKSLRAASGFTLIELVLVLTIIMILIGGAAVVLNRSGFIGAAQETKVSSDIQSISSALNAYASRYGRLPTTEQGLQALVEKTTIAPIPDGKFDRFMDEVPLDPWKQPYKYRRPPQKSKKEFDLYSIGADGVENTPDDIGNWKSADQK